MTTNSLTNTRAQQILALIKDNPDHHNQSSWHCGTNHCFVGFGDCIARAEAGDSPVALSQFEVQDECTIDAEWLGVTTSAWMILAHPTNTLPQLEILVNAINKSGDIDFAGANLTGLDLSTMYLSGVDMTRANLTRANLTKTNLARANLFRANLTGADLPRANLAKTNLTRANLTRANLFRANLAGANLTEANLTKASLAGAVFPIGG